MVNSSAAQWVKAWYGIVFTKISKYYYNIPLKNFHVETPESVSGTEHVRTTLSPSNRFDGSERKVTDDNAVVNKV